MKVTRLLKSGAWAAAAAAVACAAATSAREPARLVLRAPDLTQPLRESYPAASSPPEPVAAAVLERINADRAAAGVAPVVWDAGAAGVARSFCEAQIRERTRGHFLTDGVPPYARTAFAGVFGVQSENSTAWMTSAREFQRSMVSLALSGQAEMMDEKPPADGHRRTILDPDATHVGVGWAAAHGSFRMAQEFLTRRLAELALTRVSLSPATILVEGRLLSNARFEFITLAQEPEVRPLTREEADARTSYRYPDPRLGYVAEGRKSLRVVGTETEDRVALHGATFSFRFMPPSAGLWTVLVYTSDGRSEPRPGALAVFWVEPGGSAP